MRIPIGWTWDELQRAAMHGGVTVLSLVRLFCYSMNRCWRARNAKLHSREIGTPVGIAATIVENLALLDQVTS
ncbi:hypothetical protein KSP40_PGU005732 [Platanthera guangdongensis]|uniref:Uncharacterized protein n=1 Tax=Platanthera guangdongensis TaxID=2320717 RepID=A0ABR2N5D0_9ASPA